jgi:hypothetical protein
MSGDPDGFGNRHNSVLLSRVTNDNLSVCLLEELDRDPSISCSLTVAKICTPKMEKINRRRIMRAPTFASDGNVIIIVLKMTRRNLAFVISLKIRPILKALATVACLGPKSELVVRPIMSVIYEIITIIKSKMFQPLSK